MIAKQIVIYVPMFSIGTKETLELHRRFPNARFVKVWEEGAIMWQDALAGKLEIRRRSG